ncbi:hypothetical protein EJ07DRAFT_153608 [Lizonia empirigonia]|nr:hypothetical protein EJ07DRAFT_153608 [Lizonia empirigonia]
MSLHARDLRRLASTCAHGTVWRRRGIRCYVSQSPDGPAWFQQVRAELLSRSPVYRCDIPDDDHRGQLARTLAGFVPVTGKVRTVPRTKRTLLTALCLTQFNAQEPSAALLPDGTDALHWPGEPWVRRMWAGGAVQLRPYAESRLPRIKLGDQVACVERIKDVRLQGEDDAAKIFVTVERRFATTSRLKESAHSQPGAPGAGTHFLQQVRDGVEWGDALFKEERHLVFLKAKTDAELTAVEAGHTHEPRYLKAPTDPDFSHALTPTRALLFRYSALTFNAHLLHLDPSYARHVEGHRNLLVHGPLTLTLMLQVWAKKSPVEDTFSFESIAYRNLASLYCDEEMRVCVKKKTSTDAGSVWDVWIEGPTGGMAVKAVVRTRKSSTTASAEETSTGTSLPDVHTVAAQARQQLSALDQKHASPVQATSLSRTQRRKLWREQQRLSTSQPDMLASHALSYLYSAPSPLVLQQPPSPLIRRVENDEGGDDD